MDTVLIAATSHKRVTSGEKRKFGKLNKGQSSIKSLKTPQATLALLNHQATWVFLYGTVNSKPVAMPFDTGATRTVMRPDVINKSKKLSPNKWQLRTATGNVVKIYGETSINIRIGGQWIQHNVLIVYVEDEFMLETDVLNRHELKLDITAE